VRHAHLSAEAARPDLAAAARVPYSGWMEDGGGRGGRSTSGACAFCLLRCGAFDSRRVGVPSALRYLAPQIRVPGLPAFGGAFIDLLKFSKTFLLTLSTSVPVQAVGKPSPAAPSSLERPRK
jgi:hypothetical protein